MPGLCLFKNFSKVQSSEQFSEDKLAHSSTNVGFSASFNVSFEKSTISSPTRHRLTCFDAEISAVCPSSIPGPRNKLWLNVAVNIYNQATMSQVEIQPPLKPQLAVTSAGKTVVTCLGKCSKLDYETITSHNIKL